MNFPKTLKHGCNRSCKEDYLKIGFVYSKKHNALFCIYCVLFLPSSKKQSLGAFVQRGIRNGTKFWRKKKSIWEINTIKKPSSKPRVFAVVLKIRRNNFLQYFSKKTTVAGKCCRTQLCIC